MTKWVFGFDFYGKNGELMREMACIVAQGDDERLLELRAKIIAFDLIPSAGYASTFHVEMVDTDKIKRKLTMPHALVPRTEHLSEVVSIEPEYTEKHNEWTFAMVGESHLTEPQTCHRCGKSITQNFHLIDYDQENDDLYDNKDHLGPLFYCFDCVPIGQIKD